jgi:hypothetical protein
MWLAYYHLISLRVVGSIHERTRNLIQSHFEDSVVI